ncbi:hydrogenase iron-sulfur subunit [Desulfosoma caldarium]|uniref:Heterodisulfide reductase subunit A-like polyferredoxin n=1 Tax=Desulfosoma caldarium TaxID=610254 RepID=A0A3N1UQF4_9BACT|nr:hydrogenase iron-sulfur subunit [Desulfosoma caldarium]ROQ92313.1 heterodisulfide reductase subunit A-like polyferredoxin [Desulfosoma caldarium]
MSAIGVYICHCGHNIAGVLDVEALRERVCDVVDVAVVKTHVFCCSEPGQKEIQEDIANHGLERVLVAACSPRLHEVTFRRTIAHAGLNPYLLEMANIREQCSWVHRGPEALEKALDLILMGVARLSRLIPLSDREVPVTRRGLVIGGGVGGMSAALELADCGIPVILVEKSERLGGHAARWRISPPETDPLSCFVRPLITRSLCHPRIRVLEGCTVEDVRGYVGHFTVSLRKTDGMERFTEDVGAIVVATGFEPYEPHVSRYPFVVLPHVLTSVQLEEMFSAKARDSGVLPSALQGVRSVAFLQCVGSRLEDEYPHCSRICCAVTLKQALALRALGLEVRVFHRDIRLYDKSQEEALYGLARRSGVLFHRGTVTAVEPHVSGRLLVAWHDEFLGEDFRVPVDRLVCAVGLRPRSDAESLRTTLRLASSPDGFLLESHPKLHPLESAVEGVFLGGSCQGPKDVRETVAASMGAAAKAYELLCQDVLRLDGMIAVIDQDRCIGCGVCATECPYQAVSLQEDAQGNLKAFVETAACKGCGVCAGACPSEAADHLGYSTEALKAVVDAALAHNPEEKILALCCHWCAYAGADAAGVSRLPYPANVRIVRVPCSGRVSVSLVLHAFAQGAGRVVVAGCHPPGDCHYISGNLRFESRIPRIRKALAKKGYDPNRFVCQWISATEGPQFQQLIRRLAEEMAFDVTDSHHQATESGTAPIEATGQENTH